MHTRIALMCKYSQSGRAKNPRVSFEGVMEGASPPEVTLRLLSIPRWVGRSQFNFRR